MEAVSMELPVIHTGLTKIEIKNLSETFITKVLENGGELEVAETLSMFENFIKEVKADERLKESIRHEISLHGKIFTASSGAKIELAETGTKYDYTNCADPILQMQEQAFLSAQEAVKERQKFLQVLPQSGMDIITEDGEVVKVYPPSKTSTSSYKVTLKAK